MLLLSLAAVFAGTIVAGLAAVDLGFWLLDRLKARLGT
ncbi:MAG: hypothetical protein OZSIB_4239 [Candidatus Ozemobacter sibiricus]|jgi:hypothetical protein|uniref:Uncharacterized protein n=1 Tax=Candidatus Ozemobacter sibiricus TaxID=2268124 RepID=A0A367ZMY0_9BACT|nr:MAG: hypothetical protein OZSIB_4239 [Candidatus Ozemobacter sibiricus]